MVTASQAVVIAFVVGVVAMFAGFMVGVVRSRRFDSAERDIYPPTRLGQLLRDALDDELDRMEAEWDRRQERDR